MDLEHSQHHEHHHGESTAEEIVAFNAKALKIKSRSHTNGGLGDSNGCI